jgi:hypothetical protein
MTEYFAVIDDDGVRRGPFPSIGAASRFLKEASADRGYTEEEARQFFLHDSAIVMVETVNGQVDFINVSWLAREEAGGPMNRPEPAEALKKKIPKVKAQVAYLISLLIILVVAVGIAEIMGKISD